MPQLNASETMSAPLILAIESSCDETAAAIMKGSRLLAHVVATQMIHEQYGGVVPELAARAHQTQIIPVVEATFKRAKIKKEAITAVAVTEGPGLLGSLLVGTAFANGFALSRNIPIVGIHHTKAHLLANFLEDPKPSFPFLGLVVSGGHTQLMRVTSPLEMVLIGRTVDDAVGEAFDKIAKMMGFPYPGGCHIDRHAQRGNAKKFSFPTSKMAGLNFSFSGIKTAFLYLLERESKKNHNFVSQNRDDLAASIQSALVDMLLQKTERAMRETGMSRLVLGGGVANNSELRRRLKVLTTTNGWELYMPSPAYCTDNAAMIGLAGYYALALGNVANLPIIPRPRIPINNSK